MSNYELSKLSYENSLSLIFTTNMASCQNVIYKK